VKAILCEDDEQINVTIQGVPEKPTKFKAP